MKTKKETEPMEEAYKMLDGTPSATGVSDAAKGEHPKKDEVDFREKTEEKNERLYDQMEHDSEGNEKDPADKPEGQDKKCSDINEAYSMLFEALAIITKS